MCNPTSKKMLVDTPKWDAYHATSQRLGSLLRPGIKEDVEKYKHFGMQFIIIK